MSRRAAVARSNAHLHERSVCGDVPAVAPEQAHEMGLAQAQRLPTARTAKVAANSLMISSFTRAHCAVLNLPLLARSRQRARTARPAQVHQHGRPTGILRTAFHWDSRAGSLWPFPQDGGQRRVIEFATVAQGLRDQVVVVQTAMGERSHIHVDHDPARIATG